MGVMFKASINTKALPLVCALLYALPVHAEPSPRSAATAASGATPTVTGRAPAAVNLRMWNVTSGKLGVPMEGDQMRAEYTYNDPDGDPEVASGSTIQWFSNGTAISGANGATFTPSSAQFGKLLNFSVAPISESYADPSSGAAVISSGLSSAAVLPQAAVLAAEYTLGSGQLNWGNAYMRCASLGQRLPTQSELQATFVAYTRANAVGENSQADMVSYYGWKNQVHWTRSSAGQLNNQDVHRYVYMHTNGTESSNYSSNTYPVVCSRTGTPDQLPVVSGVSITTAPRVGSSVSGTYIYTGNGDIPDRSTYQWYTATAADGVTGRSLISGETTTSYTPVATDAGKWLVFEVTPRSYSTVVGSVVSAVSSAAVAP